MDELLGAETWRPKRSIIKTGAMLETSEGQGSKMLPGLLTLSFQDRSLLELLVAREPFWSPAPLPSCRVSVLFFFFSQHILIQRHSRHIHRAWLSEALCSQHLLLACIASCIT